MICPICANNAFKDYFQKEGYSFLQCRQCQFIFVNLASFNAADYYNNPVYLHDNEGRGYVNYEEDKAPMLPIYVNLFKRVKFYNAGRRLLDLGTASGYFLEVAHNNGYAAEGIDLNLSAVQEGRKKGRIIKQGDLLESGYSEESFDIITAFDIFEHLPYDVLKENIFMIKKILSKNGVLAIITVNTASWWARIFGKRWHTWLPPEHVSYFNNKNIKLFLENNGFKVLEIKTVHKLFSLQYIFNFLYRWQRVFIWRYLTLFLEKNPWLGRIALKLYLGDNMLILARKKL